MNFSQQYICSLNISRYKTIIYTFAVKVEINNPKDAQQHVLKMILGKSTGTERRNKQDWWYFSSMTASNIPKGRFNFKGIPYRGYK